MALSQCLPSIQCRRQHYRSLSDTPDRPVAIAPAHTLTKVHILAPSPTSFGFTFDPFYREVSSGLNGQDCTVIASFTLSLTCDSAGQSATLFPFSFRVKTGLSFTPSMDTTSFHYNYYGFLDYRCDRYWVWVFKLPWENYIDWLYRVLSTVKYSYLR